MYEVLKAKLGREPTHNEIVADVRRVLREASDKNLVKFAQEGRLPHQRKARSSRARHSR